MALMGDLCDLSLPDLLYIFNLRGMTGRLSLQSGTDDAMLFFHRGKLVYVGSSKVSQNLGHLLVRLGKISAEQLAHALKLQATTARHQALGEILVSSQWITDDDLNAALTYQAEEILFRVLSWSDGTFSFSSGDTASLRLPLSDLNVERVILEATRRADEWATIRARIPSLECGIVLLDNPSHGELTDRLRLKEKIFIASIIEGARSLRQIAAASGMDDEEVMRIAYDLANQELLAITLPRVPSPAPGAPTAAPPAPGNGRAEPLNRRETTQSLRPVHSAPEPSRPTGPGRDSS